MVAMRDGGCTGVRGGGRRLCVIVAALVCVVVAVRDGSCV